MPLHVNYAFIPSPASSYKWINIFISILDLLSSFTARAPSPTIKIMRSYLYIRLLWLLVQDAFWLLVCFSIWGIELHHRPSNLPNLTVTMLERKAQGQIARDSSLILLLILLKRPNWTKPQRKIKRTNHSSHRRIEGGRGRCFVWRRKVSRMTLWTWLPLFLLP